LQRTRGSPRAGAVDSRSSAPPGAGSSSRAGIRRPTATASLPCCSASCLVMDADLWQTAIADRARRAGAAPRATP